MKYGNSKPPVITSAVIRVHLALCNPLFDVIFFQRLFNDIGSIGEPLHGQASVMSLGIEHYLRNSFTLESQPENDMHNIEVEPLFRLASIGLGCRNFCQH